MEMGAGDRQCWPAGSAQVATKVGSRSPVYLLEDSVSFEGKE